jgi:WD40 repeat protein
MKLLRLFIDDRLPCDYYCKFTSDLSEKMAASSSEMKGIRPKREREKKFPLFGWVGSAPGKATLAALAVVLFAAIAYFGFFISTPTGNPFWKAPENYWQAVFNRAHEKAYAHHDYRPVGAEDQFFHVKNRIEYWQSETPPIKDLVRNAGDNTWRIRREGKAELDIVIRRFFVSSNLRRVGGIDMAGGVHFYDNEQWVRRETLVRGGIEGAEPVQSLDTQVQMSPSIASFSADGGRVLTVWSDFSARILDASTGAELVTLTGHEDLVFDAAFSTDDSRVVTSSNDGTARVWDATTGTELTILSGHKALVGQAVFSPDGSQIVTVSHDTTARIWDAAKGAEIAILSGHGSSVLQAAYSPDGSQIVTVSADGTAILWDALSAVAIGALPGLKGTIAQAAFSPDGSLVVTASSDGTAILWDAATAGQRATLFGHTAEVSHATFSPKVPLVLTASHDGTARLWDAVTGAQFATLTGHTGGINHTTFSPDGNHIVTASRDGTAKLWDAETHAEIATLQGNGDSVQHAAFSSDGSRIVTTTREGLLQLWQIVYSNDRSVRVTALDVTSGLIFGEERLLSDAQNKASFFPSIVRAVIQGASPGERIAVGDGGAIYIGRIAPPSATPGQGGSGSTADPNGSLTDQVDSANDDSVAGQIIGSIGGFDWYVAELPEDNANARALRAVQMAGQFAIAVGDGGLVKVSRDGGSIWQSGTIDGDHTPDLKDARINADQQYAVAIGRPTIDGAPLHGVLYRTTDRSLSLDPTSAGIGEWQHVPWEASAPMMAYAAIVLALAALFLALYYLRYWWIARGDNSGPVTAGKSDREIGWEDGVDVLGLKSLAMQVSMFLRNAQTEPPLVLGVAGGWGSGKSSLMNLLCQDLRRRGTSAVKFNAWHHQNEEHLLAALFEAVRTRAIPPFWTFRGMWFRTRLVIPRLWRQLFRALPVILIIGLIVIVAGIFITDKQISLLQDLTGSFRNGLVTEDKSSISLTGYFVAGVPALGLVLWLRSLWVALPAKPVKLLKNFTSLTRVTDFADKLSFRYNFGRAFGEVCRALRMPGVPGLVIFIDDLDRCQAKAVLSIFEAVNYFVSVGDCIVVMGFDRAQVEHSIGHELGAIAEGMPDSEIPFAFGEGKGDKSRAYARHYMEKLINLEITIPPMDANAAAALVEGTANGEPDLEDRDKEWLQKTRPAIQSALRASAFAVRLLVLGVIGAYFWQYGNSLYSRVNASKAEVVQEQSHLEIALGSASPSGTAQQDRPETRIASATIDQDDTQPSTVSAANSDVALAKPEEAPQPVTPIWNKQELWVLLPLLAFLMLLIAWVFLRRAYEIRKNVEHDPQTFITALSEANRVIEGVNGTPRAVKRFMNRMRFASARMRNIHYQTGLLDWVAERLKWVTENFADGSEEKSRIKDPQIIAIGTMEAFVQHLPDPDQVPATPDALIDEFVAQRTDKEEARKIAGSVKALLKKAGVRKTHLQDYVRTMNASSSAAGAPKDSPPVENKLKAI